LCTDVFGTTIRDVENRNSQFRMQLFGKVRSLEMFAEIDKILPN